MPAWRLVRHKTLKGADAVFCPQCGRVIADRCDAYWGIDKTRALHIGGTGHKPFYVRLETAE